LTEIMKEFSVAETFDMISALAVAAVPFQMLPLIDIPVAAGAGAGSAMVTRALAPLTRFGA
jgi:hypothetical protein